MESKRRGVDVPEGKDDTIDELFSVIEDGQAFRNRRKGGKKSGGKGSADLFLSKQEEMVRLDLFNWEISFDFFV